MTWDEFSSLLCGLGADSLLVRIVRIRSETDKETIKRFTKEQKKIRNDWIRRGGRTKGEADEKIIEKRDIFLKNLADSFRSMKKGR